MLTVYSCEKRILKIHLGPISENFRWKNIIIALLILIKYLYCYEYLNWQIVKNTSLVIYYNLLKNNSWSFIEFLIEF